MEYSSAYEKIAEFAKFHDFKLEYGLFTTKNKIEEYLSESKLLSEININLFVMVKFAGDIYVALLKSEAADDLSKLTSIVNMAKNFTELLIITPNPKSTKLNNLASEHMPKLNFINIIAFISSMKHCFSPKSVVKINYEDEEKVLMVDKKNLMEINFHDPLVAWMRFKPGDVLSILNYSFVTGYDTHYRLVKHFTK